MKIAADLLAHRRDFARAVANHKYEASPEGVYFPLQKAFIQGHMESWVNHADLMVSPNIIPTAALNHILSVLVAGGTQINPWYVALFSANVTPQDTLTAANWVAAQTEYVGYSETTRVTYVDGTIAAGAVSNTASRAEFTIVTPATIYGGTLVSAQAKSAVIGEILACSKFSAGRAVILADTLQVAYSLSAASA